MSQLEAKKIQLTLEVPEEVSRPEKVVGDADGITVVNDTSQGACAFVNNDILGPASLGHVRPGQSVVLPCGWAWWDLYVLFDDQAGWFVRWASAAVYFVNPNNKLKHGVGYRDTVYLSKM